jgi:hypothetical protein
MSVRAAQAGEAQATAALLSLCNPPDVPHHRSRVPVHDDRQRAVAVARHRQRNDTPRGSQVLAQDCAHSQGGQAGRTT